MMCRRYLTSSSCNAPCRPSSDSSDCNVSNLSTFLYSMAPFSTTKGNKPIRIPGICYYLRMLFGSHRCCSSFVSRREYSGIPFAKQSRSLRQNSSRLADSPIPVRYLATIRPEALKPLRPDYGKTAQFFRSIRREKQASRQWAMGYLQFLMMGDSSFRQPITRIRE